MPEVVALRKIVRPDTNKAFICALPLGFSGPTVPDDIAKRLCDNDRPQPCGNYQGERKS